MFVSHRANRPLTSDSGCVRKIKQRQHDRAELEGEHDEDEQDGHHHDDEQAAERLLLPQVVAAEFPVVAGRQSHVGHPPADVGDDGAQAGLLLVQLGGDE